jgi:intracellular sulfur oxidation DsrE/DsrF family protein
VHDSARHAAVRPGIGCVDAGMVEIMQKQRQVWACIRP